jgi:DNA-binding winged helix-turn-helix (wHTH) protein/tetratricopeptide (TPR) repeat protein
LNDFGVDLYSFGGFVLEARERRLVREGKPIALKPRAFDTLLYLVQHAGHLVTKEELMERLWPNVVVEESNLAKNIWLIRRALGEPEGEARYIETVPRAGYRFIAPVETAERASAPAAVESPLPAAPQEPVTTVPAPEPLGDPPASAPKRSRARWIVGLALAALAVLGASLYWARSHRAPVPEPTSPSSPPGAARRASIAVLGFSNLSHQTESAWMSVALSEMLSADLAVGERLRLVPGADAARLNRTLPSELGALSRHALNDARDQLDADFVVTGSYMTIAAPEGGLLRVDVLLQNTASGDTVLAVTRTGPSHTLFAVVDEAAGQLLSRLGYASPSGPLAAAVVASMPSRPEATRLYVEGLTKQRLYDALGARPLFERAIAVQPEFPLAHYALSQAFASLGYDQRAAEEAQEAAKLSTSLPREQQLAITAGLAESRKDWPAAERAYRSLFDVFPDNLEYGLDLVRVQIAAGRAQEALRVTPLLRRAGSGVDPDPRIDLAEATSYAALSDPQHELMAATKAVALARPRGLRLLLGESLFQQGRATAELGDPKRAVALYQEAAAIFHQQGDIANEADTIIALANDRGGSGDSMAGERDYRKALAVYERIGHRKGAEHALQDLANIAWMTGNAEEAQKDAQRALELSREINDRRGITWSLGAIGNMLADGGKIDQALAMQSQALATAREIGDRAYTSFCIASLGDTYLAAGRLAEARAQYTESLNLSRTIKDLNGIAVHEGALGVVELSQNRLDEADRLLTSAVDDFRRLLNNDAAEGVRLTVAQLRLEQGRRADALAVSRDLVQKFVTLREPVNQALALSTAAWAEVTLGQVDAAQTDIAKASELLKGNHQNQATLYWQLVLARVEAARGHGAEARKVAGAALAQAQHLRALATVLDAKLVLAEISFASNPTDGRQPLESLAQEADKAGFALIARKAHSTASGRVSARTYP